MNSSGHDRRSAIEEAGRPEKLDAGMASDLQTHMDLAMRGFFAVGAEGISKAMNFVGNLVRSAHAFGASFVFLVRAEYGVRSARSDTSQAEYQLPVYDFASAEELRLPRGCRLVGCELVDDAVDLPSFCHPPSAAYVFGPERSSLSPAMLARCHHVVRIPNLVLHQPCRRRCHRHVRPAPGAGTLRPSTAARGRSARAASQSCSRRDPPLPPRSGREPVSNGRHTFTAMT